MNTQMKRSFRVFIYQQSDAPSCSSFSTLLSVMFQSMIYHLNLNIWGTFPGRVWLQTSGKSLYEQIRSASPSSHTQFDLEQM